LVLLLHIHNFFNIATYDCASTRSSSSALWSPSTITSSVSITITSQITPIATATSVQASSSPGDVIQQPTTPSPQGTVTIFPGSTTTQQPTMLSMSKSSNSHTSTNPPTGSPLPSNILLQSTTPNQNIVVTISVNVGGSSTGSVTAGVLVFIVLVVTLSTMLGAAVLISKRLKAKRKGSNVLLNPTYTSRKKMM